MSNTNVPSKDRIHIFKESNIQETLANTPSLSLFDYETGKTDDCYEYWYCPKCQRVHIVEKSPSGNIIATFHKADNNDTVDSTGLHKIYAVSDEDIYNAEEENFKVTLADYVDIIKHTHTYHITSTNDLVYKQEDNQFKLVYEKEKNVPSTATNS